MPSSTDYGITPSFGVEISGTLAGVDVNTGLIGTVIKAIAQITSDPVKKVIIHFVEFRAEIQIISDNVDRQVRVAQFRNIAEVYNQALNNADSIWYHSDKMKEEYIRNLEEDYIQQFRKLLHSG